jgi:hypothetical protein
LGGFCIDVTSSQKVTESRYEIPLRLAACASASLLAQQKFDSAQDDRLTVYLVIIFAFDNLIFNKPLEK